MMPSQIQHSIINPTSQPSELLLITSNQQASFITPQQQSGVSDKVFNIFLGSHTQFLQIFKSRDKAFRFECTVLSDNDTLVTLRKAVIQANQGSEMNIISKQLIRHLGLSLISLKEAGFENLIMRTVDHRDTSLKY